MTKPIVLFFHFIALSIFLCTGVSANSNVTCQSLLSSENPKVEIVLASDAKTANEQLVAYVGEYASFYDLQGIGTLISQLRDHPEKLQAQNRMTLLYLQDPYILRHISVAEFKGALQFLTANSEDYIKYLLQIFSNAAANRLTVREGVELAGLATDEFTRNSILIRFVQEQSASFSYDEVLMIAQAYRQNTFQNPQSFLKNFLNRSIQYAVNGKIKKMREILKREQVETIEALIEYFKGLPEK